MHTCIYENKCRKESKAQYLLQICDSPLASSGLTRGKDTDKVSVTTYSRDNNKTAYTELTPVKANDSLMLFKFLFVPEQRKGGC